MVEGTTRDQEALFLPPGFRFHPTDEEIITRYLMEKFLNPSFTSRAVGEVDLNKCEPWDLPSKAKMGEKEWYFFCQKDMKYPTGMRTNRATKAGYWKATGKDKEIFKGKGVLVGMKKTLVFYEGRAPKGLKTNWVMHEFRLEGKSKDNMNLHINPKDEWVVSKVFHKKGGSIKKATDTGIPRVNSVNGGDDFVDSLIDLTYFNSNNLPNRSHGSATGGNAATYTTDYTAVMGLEDPTQKSTASFLPNYSLNASNQVMNSSIPTSTSQSSSWNMLQGSAHTTGSYLYQDHQAMVKALGGVIGPNFATSKGLPNSAVGVSQSTIGMTNVRNSLGVPQQKLEIYGPYASYLTGTSTATAGPANYLGTQKLHY